MFHKLHVHGMDDDLWDKVHNNIPDLLRTMLVKVSVKDGQASN